MQHPAIAAGALLYIFDRVHDLIQPAGVKGARVQLVGAAMVAEIQAEK